MFLDSIHGATNEAVAKSLLDEAAAVRRLLDEAIVRSLRVGPAVHS